MDSSSKTQPDAYQKGWVEFYKLRFKVTSDTLIPRPETELLVDAVLNFIKTLTPQTPLTILDIGTGSGNIAISIAKSLNLHLESVNLNIIATDISPKALVVARRNAKLYNVEDKITFLQSDLLSTLKGSSFSIVNCPLIIVTNLPYIPSLRIPYLDSSVKDFEPHIALDGGPDGFDLYRKLFQQISNLRTWFGTIPTIPVWKVGLIICEIDYTQGELAVTEAQKYFPEAKVEVKTDLAHKQRILTITH